MMGVWVDLLSPLCGLFTYQNLLFFLAALGDKIVRDIRPGAAFEPTYIYRLLTVIKSSLSEKVWGALWLLWKLLPRAGGGGMPTS